VNFDQLRLITSCGGSVACGQYQHLSVNDINKASSAVNVVGTVGISIGRVTIGARVKDCLNAVRIECYESNNETKANIMYLYRYWL